jgi:acyl transferase domain-containing protein
LITGIPALVQEFVESRKLNATNLPVCAPFHAAHLYSDNDVDRIVKSFPATIPNTTSKCTLFSRQDGTPTTPTPLRSLLTMAVKAVLQEPLASDDILAAIKKFVLKGAEQPIRIISIGTTYGLELSKTLKEIAQDVKYFDDLEISRAASASAHPRQDKIAITGFSGRFPEAENLKAFWDVIHNGVDTHSETPATRWNNETHVDTNLKRKNTSATPYGCWLNNPGNFDRSFFSISPREAPQMDPAQRLALMCAYEAIEMAGIVPDSTASTMRSRVGVFIGCTSNDWCETNSPQDIDFYFIPGGNRAFIPGRINYYFKFCGPSFSIDTACSSSLAAIHLACNALWRKEIDTAIVGGTNVLTNPDVTAGLDRGHFLSRTGNCKTFDDSADGYCRGEGVGIVVLKRLEDAQAENDPIQACILSAGTNHSAEAESITRPHAGAQIALLSQVLYTAGVQPNDVSYVEMHGTGTQAGDGREMTSVSKTFAPWAVGDPRGRTTDLFIGSVKANVGHSESASGVTALIKTMLMMKNNEIPPNCGIKTKLNTTFPTDLAERHIQIARKPTPWIKSNGAPRRAVINNFSAAGGNSCIVIEDPPERVLEEERTDTRSAHVVTVTAKSQTALQGNIRSLAKLLRDSKDTLSLPDIAYTTTARRVHYNFRTSYVAQTIEELTTLVEQEAANPPARVRGPPKNIFAFSGQGSNQAGMAKQLYDTNSTFRMDLNRLDAIVQELGFDSVLPYLTGLGEANKDAPSFTTQLAQVVLQLGLSRLWRAWGVVPTAVIGHSLGEYAALNYAGVLSDFDTLWLCGQRAKLLAAYVKPGTHTMLAIRTSQKDVVANLQGITHEIACLNNDTETVISGLNENIDLCAQKLQSQGIRCTRIPVPYAFHSSQLQPILDDFSKILDGVTFRSPRVQIISPLLSSVINAGEVVGKDYLLRQCREAVNLIGAVKAAEAAAIFDDRSHIIEMGPSAVLARLIKRSLEIAPTIMQSLEPKQDSWAVVGRSIATAYRVGSNVNWGQFHRDYDHTVVQLPSYAWDLKNYWLQYVHDWSLRKGEPLPEIASSSESRLKLDSVCCQKLISADFEVCFMLSSQSSLVCTNIIHRENRSMLLLNLIFNQRPLNQLQEVTESMASPSVSE